VTAGFQVRRATADDIEATIDLFEAVVEEGTWLGAQPPIDRDRRREQMLDTIANERSAPLVAVTDDGAVVGNLTLDVAPYGVAQFGMCVAAGWRGRGVGGALVDEGVAAARRLGAHKVSIQVWPHNHAARRLYRGRGFVEEGRLRRHYPRHNGELWDAIVMGLVLDEERPGSSLAEDVAPEEARDG
jgi:RimJ/RimL family protein N-acetyltransferase